MNWLTRFFRRAPVTKPAQPKESGLTYDNPTGRRPSEPNRQDIPLSDSRIKRSINKDMTGHNYAALEARVAAAHAAGHPVVLPHPLGPLTPPLHVQALGRGKRPVPTPTVPPRAAPSPAQAQDDGFLTGLAAGVVLTDGLGNYSDPVPASAPDTFSGGGGDFSGAGASGGWDAPSDSGSSYSSDSSSSDSSSSYDGGSSDGGSSGGGD